jgi:hypothetical protein
MPATKKPTPLSTRSLAAFLTWKQYDVLLLLQQEGVLAAHMLADFMTDIREYDAKHGGQFYKSTTSSSVGSTLRSLERRNLVRQTRHTQPQWTTTARGERAISFLEDSILEKR